MGSLERSGKRRAPIFVAVSARDDGIWRWEQKNGGSVEAAQFKVFGDADRHQQR